LISPYEIDMTATGLHPVVLTVKNVSDATLTFTVTVQPTLGNFEYGQNDGLTLSLTSSRIIVSPRLSATLGLTAKADLSKLPKDHMKRSFGLAMALLPYMCPCLYGMILILFGGKEAIRLMQVTTVSYHQS